MEAVDAIAPRGLAPLPKKSTLSNVASLPMELPNLPVNDMKKHIPIVEMPPASWR
jgi:hypothetical protein